MPLKFNQKELAVLASQPGAEFDKEGLLMFKEKEKQKIMFQKVESKFNSFVKVPSADFTL